MEKPSPILEQMNGVKFVEKHPGTLNIRNRRNEAQRIHHQNLLLASRLDSMQPHYKKADLCVLLATPSKHKKRPKSKQAKTRFANEIEMVLNNQGRSSPSSRRPPSTARTERSPPSRYTPSSSNPSTSRGTSNNHNVLLEYTKIQDGRVLEVAIIKEPFRDRYAIFGIDVDNGQRYELRLTSEEVTNILDGDILVTSVENAEVWMALLTKVELKRVENFVKAIPGSSAQRLQVEEALAHSNSNKTASPASNSRTGSALKMTELGVLEVEGISMPMSTSEGSFNKDSRSNNNNKVPSRPLGMKPSHSGGGSAARIAALRPVLEQAREARESMEDGSQIGSRRVHSGARLAQAGMEPNGKPFHMSSSDALAPFGQIQDVVSE